MSFNFVRDNSFGNLNCNHEPPQYEQPIRSPWHNGSENDALSPNFLIAPRGENQLYNLQEQSFQLPHSLPVQGQAPRLSFGGPCLPPMNEVTRVQQIFSSGPLTSDVSMESDQQIQYSQPGQEPPITQMRRCIHSLAEVVFQTSATMEEKIQAFNRAVANCMSGMKNTPELVSFIPSVEQIRQDEITMFTRRM